MKVKDYIVLPQIFTILTQLLDLMTSYDVRLKTTAIAIIVPD